MKFKGVHKKKHQPEHTFKKTHPKKHEEKSQKKRIWLQGLPKNSRLIAEKVIHQILKRQFWVVVLIIICVLSIGVLGVDIYLRTQQLQQAQIVRQKMLHERDQWVKVTQDKPGYRDGYMQVAYLSYSLGDFVEATTAVTKALEIDPNYVPALKLKGYLITK